MEHEAKAVDAASMRVTKISEAFAKRKGAAHQAVIPCLSPCLPPFIPPSLPTGRCFFGGVPCGLSRPGRVGKGDVGPCACVLARLHASDRRVDALNFVVRAWRGPGGGGGSRQRRSAVNECLVVSGGLRPTDAFDQRISAANGYSCGQRMPALNRRLRATYISAHGTGKRCFSRVFFSQRPTRQPLVAVSDLCSQDVLHIQMVCGGKQNPW